MTIRHKRNSIFISIASYRDSELIPSIVDCVQKASNKNRLFFGICLQDDNNKYLHLKHIRKKYKLNMRIVFVDWKDSQGACWARHTIQKKLYQNQNYYLQLDSHHRFIEQWDDVLIDILENKKNEGSKKPIIGGYCPGYNNVLNTCDAGGIQISSFDSFTEDGDLIFRPVVLSEHTCNTTTVPARFLSGHFIFSDGKFCQECLYDPNLYFRGEEITLSARAYTAGYDFFHPTFPIIWHFYLRPQEQKHWDNHQNGHGFIISTTTRELKAKERVRKLFGMEVNNINFGRYGLGRQRLLHEYELYAGLDFSQKKVHKYCANTRNETVFPFILSENEWENGMLTKKLVSVRLPENSVDYINGDLESLIMCIENYQHKLLHRYDIKPEELIYVLKNDLTWTKQIGIEDLPTHAIIIPFLKNHTFGPRLQTTEISYYDVN